MLQIKTWALGGHAILPKTKDDHVIGAGGNQMVRLERKIVKMHDRLSRKAGTRSAVVGQSKTIGGGCGMTMARRWLGMDTGAMTVMTQIEEKSTMILQSKKIGKGYD
ncbi:hypothetical protein L1987_62582 [Smallanthus sonchifolius]|uniref:Uncharacterized protein n=1 Tax=Smallanthus sonchifolius TaxID=185202 RepID=A0ACB9CAV7_9ASTR|nr:hypothetical protein L1987_62582 [Smallanthus sonchifolius]